MLDAFFTIVTHLDTIIEVPEYAYEYISTRVMGTDVQV
jgi:hypothetical protein